MCGDAPDSEPYCQWCCKPRRLCTCEKGKLAKEATRPHTPAHSDEEKIDAAITFACEKHDAAIASTATLAAIEMLSDLNKYSCEEYEEASLSDNEKEMRIHLEYGNRLWGVIRSLRTAQEQQR
jgi:hypothetical protein